MKKTTLIIDDVNANKPIMSKAESIITAEIEKLKVLAEKSDDETLQYCELDIRKNQIYLLKSILNKIKGDDKKWADVVKNVMK